MQRRHDLLHDLAEDCRGIGLDFPGELLDGLSLGRPGETLAAIYCWQALCTFLGLSERDQDLAGNCMVESYRDDDQRSETLLTDIDGCLSLMLGECREQAGAEQWPTTLAALLTYAGNGAERLLEMRSGIRHNSPLRSDDALLRPVERFELTIGGVRAGAIREIETIIYWLQMGIWAMSCAELGGRRYLAAITNQKLVERPCPPEHADRLLLRLGANRVPLPDCIDLVGELPLSWRRVFWPEDLPALAFDLEREQPSARAIPLERLALLLGRAIEIGGFRFRLGSVVRPLDRSGSDRSGADQATDQIPVMIWSPAGWMLGALYIDDREPLIPALHVPVIESIPGYATNLQAIQAIQDIQALFSLAVCEAAIQ